MRPGFKPRLIWDDHAMKLEGIHHVASITGDAQANVDFYAGVLGLRMVKKTVNQDDPTVYHLFYGDDRGSPGLDLTFFEYPGARPGRAGRGVIHRIVMRVSSEAAGDFWARRPHGAGRRGRFLLFNDPEGAGPVLRPGDTGCGAAGVARARRGGRREADPGDRPLLVQVGLLPGAEWGAVRDRHPGSRLCGRRGPGASR